MRRGNRRIRKARAGKRRWLVAEHLTRAGDGAGPRLMEVLIRAHRIAAMPNTFIRTACALWPLEKTSQSIGRRRIGAE